MGYWDLHGYPNMFTASGWSAVSQTANVQDQISSPAHNAKYDPTPDNASLPVPAKTSIADFLGTSVDPLGYGSTYTSKIPSGLTGYASYRGYASSSQENLYLAGILGLTWSKLVGEINAGRPMLFDVDSNGDGKNDHSVPVFGYDDRGSAGKYFGCYTTWSEDETIAWYPFRGMSTSYTFGIYDGDTFKITSAASSVGSLAMGFSNVSSASDVPEPSTLVLLGISLAGWLVYVIRKKK